jgi:hypothetical protein
VILPVAEVGFTNTRSPQVRSGTAGPGSDGADSARITVQRSLRWHRARFAAPHRRDVTRCSHTEWQLRTQLRPVARHSMPTSPGVLRRQPWQLPVRWLLTPLAPMRSLCNRGTDRNGLASDRRRSRRSGKRGGISLRYRARAGNAVFTPRIGAPDFALRTHHDQGPIRIVCPRDSTDLPRGMNATGE